jgi:hypothetical protein
LLQSGLGGEIRVDPTCRSSLALGVTTFPSARTAITNFRQEQHIPVPPFRDWRAIPAQQRNQIFHRWRLHVPGNAGTYSFVQNATLSGVTGLTDEAALVSNGNLVVT